MQASDVGSNVGRLRLVQGGLSLDTDRFDEVSQIHLSQEIARNKQHVNENHLPRFQAVLLTRPRESRTSPPEIPAGPQAKLPQAPAT